jgi:kinesin family protein C2/C3
MAQGAANRHTSQTKMNDRSSRSHQILTVIVDGVNLLSGARTHGCLHLIDLAGSERVGKSEASGARRGGRQGRGRQTEAGGGPNLNPTCRVLPAAGDRLVEAQHINRSLSALGDVMAALASKSSHVPFRNSKLTQLLQDSLSGQAKVRQGPSARVGMHQSTARSS